MHTEQLHDIRPVWVASGWLVSIAIASLIVLTLASFELVGPDPEDGALWSVVAVALGFWVGGLFTGVRALRAPILHGIAMGLATLVAWFVVNLMTVPLPRFHWEALPPALTAGLLLVQMIAAVAGALVGQRLALRGGAELAEP